MIIFDHFMTYQHPEHSIIFSFTHSLSQLSLAYQKKRHAMQSLLRSCGQLARRQLHATARRQHGYSPSEVDAKTAVRVTFVERDGTQREVMGPPGRSLLEIAHSNDIDLEGACEGSLACSTCHVYLDQVTFDKLEEPCDDECDMLDLAFALSEQYVIFSS